MTITEFLLARIADDEAGAGAIPHDRPWLVGLTDPRRIRRECAAKRRIVEQASATPTCGGHDPEFYAHFEAEYGFTPARHLPEEYAAGCDGCAAAESVGIQDQTYLRALATIYADHPDYREEWAARADN